MKAVNFEVYTKNPETGETGWDIFRVSVIAEDSKEARELLKNWKLFDCVILHNFTVDNETDYKHGDIFYQYYNISEQGLVSDTYTIEQKFEREATV